MTELDLDDVAAQSPLAQKELSDLRLEAERLRRDASRYQWLLRNADLGITKRQYAVLYVNVDLVAPDGINGLSAAIDSALNDGLAVGCATKRGQ